MENIRLYNYKFLLKFLLNFYACMDTPFLCFYYVFYYRNESEAIKTIVENVKRLLDQTELFVADNPVGVEPRVQEMIELIDQKQSNDVLLLGMWGMGGIGKTTMAKVIYNKIGRNFEEKSFLAHIREVWEQDAGLSISTRTTSI